MSTTNQNSSSNKNDVDEQPPTATVAASTSITSPSEPKKLRLSLGLNKSKQVQNPIPTQVGATATTAPRLSIRLPSANSIAATSKNHTPTSNDNNNENVEIKDKEIKDEQESKKSLSTFDTNHDQFQEPQTQNVPRVPPIPHFDKTPAINYNQHQKSFSTVNQVHIHHQSSTLHYCYNHYDNNSSGKKWYCQGKTTIYLTLDISSSKNHNNNNHSNDDNDNTNKNNSKDQEMKMIMKEIALHLRHGQSITITNTKAYTPLPIPIDNDGNAKSATSLISSSLSMKTLAPLPQGSVSYFDPLHKIYTKRANTFNAMEYTSDNADSTRNKRYECDGFSAIKNGGCSFMEEMRCCCIASNFGELRIQVTCPADNEDEKSEENKNDILKELWRDDLLHFTSGEGANFDDGDEVMHDSDNNEDKSNSDNQRQRDDEFVKVNGGALEMELKRKCVNRSDDRRRERIELIATRLANNDSSIFNEATASSSDNKDNKTNDTDTINKKRRALGIKLVVDFCIDPISGGSHHFGGIHFHSPPTYSSIADVITTSNQTPHVYTTSGITGDNFGPRCFIPTIDSSSIKHRFSHELTIKVTSHKDQGLWPAGCGEHYGVNGTVIHSIPRYIQSKTIDNRIKESKHQLLEDRKEDEHNLISSEHDENPTKEEEAMHLILGKESVNFIAKSFSYLSPKPSSSATLTQQSYTGIDSHIHIIPSDDNTTLSSLSLTRHLATSIWTTSIWSPCPARSIGFAIGPFKVIYDPEYYGKQDDDEEVDGEDGHERDDDSVSEQEKEDDNDDDEDYPTISETALVNGEGIRQLYFALFDERDKIHSEAPVITAAGLVDASDIRKQDGKNIMIGKPSSLPTRIQKKQYILSIMGATAGVTNRALSLMRDILALPSYRTMSYTQIWIPNAIDGGSSCGALHSCPEVSCNPFLGGAIMDATILPPLGQRLPFYFGGRSLQLLQARNAVRGWIRAALPLGGTDEIGYSYIHTLFESFIMSLYERSHGAFGEGGSKQSFYFSKRFAIGSGLNSRNLDFLPIHNVEEEEDFSFALGGVVGALPAEDQSNEKLWRNMSNGTETHTAARDEMLIRQLLGKDILEALERADKSSSLPSHGWLGSFLSASFLSSNSTSSSGIGCGAVELFHPVGGLVYRTLKCRSLRRVIEGRAGLSNFIRVLRAAFIAGVLHDKGATRVDLPSDKLSKKKELQRARSNSIGTVEDNKPKPRFVHCVDEILKKGGMTHGSFVRSLQNISGPIRHPYLGGTLVDVSRDAFESSFLQPEGFPNSFVRGASSLYLRVGTLVDGSNPGDKQSAIGSNKLQVVVEPVIPNGGVAFGGPVTIRVIENGGQGQCNEYVKSIPVDGRRIDWGPIFLHGDPVTTPKQQNAANGLVESSTRKKNDKSGKKKDLDDTSTPLTRTVNVPEDSVFNGHQLHQGGYQALELVRLTNLSQLLWVRVDPLGLYDGRIALFQQDSCLGEQLFHDGEASAQVEALRALAERPLPLQGASKIKNIYGVPVTELPVRLLADCLRGSVALHADLPHNPAVRAQAALAIAQWQNNKAPNNKDSVEWVGLTLLMQYFNERFRKYGNIIPAKFLQICLKTASKADDANTTGGAQIDDTGQYQYLDNFEDPSVRKEVIERAIEIEPEEDEEYRVRSSVVIAIACCRAKDGQTPPLVLSFLEEILQGDDDCAVTNLLTLEEGQLIRKKKAPKIHEQEESLTGEDTMVIAERNLFEEINDIPYTTSSLIAETLLSLCYINASPSLIEDPTTGKISQSKANHPVIPLMQLCYRWLQWDLYKEDIRLESEMANKTGIGKFSVIAPCAITGLCSLALLRQVTTDSDTDTAKLTDTNKKRMQESISRMIDDATSVQYYIDIFNARPIRSDAIRAAAAQAITCLCCAVDRNETDDDARGLLKALQFLLECILEPTTSPKLRQTLALIMLDACTGKVGLNHRVANLTTSNDLISGGTRLLNGPLGASYGNDVGNTIFTSVSELSLPAANAVNEGARRGMRVLRTAGKSIPPDRLNQKKPPCEKTVVQVATFATSLWRTINGELGGSYFQDDLTINAVSSTVDGVCAFDGYLRCSLLALWQCIWPNNKNGNGLCVAVQRVQSWRAHSGSQRYKDLGAEKVMNVEDDERLSADIAFESNESIRNIVVSEIDRQRWRGEMAKKLKDSINESKDPTAASQGLNLPLDTVDKDDAWRLGAWVTSTAHQRRAKGADGGSMVSATKLRLTMKS